MTRAGEIPQTWTKGDTAITATGVITGLWGLRVKGVEMVDVTLRMRADAVVERVKEAG